MRFVRYAIDYSTFRNGENCEHWDYNDDEAAEHEFDIGTAERRGLKGIELLQYEKKKRKRLWEIRMMEPADLDPLSFMHMTQYKDWAYTMQVAEELVDMVTPDEVSLCKRTLVWIFDYAVNTWGFDRECRDHLVHHWLMTEGGLDGNGIEGYDYPFHEDPGSEDWPKLGILIRERPLRRA